LATFAAFYDANALYPAELRRVDKESSINRPDLTRVQLERTRGLMDHHALDALVTGYEDLIPDLHLPESR
jgi:hypothetical protein